MPRPPGAGRNWCAAPFVRLAHAGRRPLRRRASRHADCRAVGRAPIGAAFDDVVFGVTTIFHVFGIGPGVLGTALAGAAWVLLGYGLPITVLAYVILRNKEVAP